MTFLIRWFKRLAVIGWLLLTLYLASPVILNVPLEKQYPALPNGCEAVSLAMTLSYWQLPTSGVELVNGYLPRAPLGTVLPQDAYMGDPTHEDGHYCYPAPLATAANAYLAERQSPLRASTPVALGWYRLTWELHRSHPVICWITVDDELPRRQPGVAWRVGDEVVKPYENLHVVVVDGVRWGSLHVADPIHGERWLPLYEFLKMYVAMGLKSVVIR